MRSPPNECWHESDPSVDVFPAHAGTSPIPDHPSCAPCACAPRRNFAGLTNPAKWASIRSELSPAVQNLADRFIDGDMRMLPCACAHPPSPRCLFCFSTLAPLVCPDRHASLSMGFPYKSMTVWKSEYCSGVLLIVPPEYTPPRPGAQRGP